MGGEHIGTASLFWNHFIPPSARRKGTPREMLQPFRGRLFLKQNFPPHPPRNNMIAQTSFTMIAQTST
jgi:hypothetical protein